MKIIFTLLLLCCFALYSNAQNISSEVISSLGGEFSTPTNKLSFTVGETSISYFRSNDKVLSEGFHQSYLDVISAVEDLEEISSFKMYPNPTSDLLY
ncbi:MAG: hypothetical protein P8M34_02800 [Saprospiraceae bacterium]|nr:hypothetical protein [Saprospiraceae bacterium]|tara:strand:+ start:1602 stop:1892 length:291 start_codon:yes stop_codon:yes gene_type:complete